MDNNAQRRFIQREIRVNDDELGLEASSFLFGSKKLVERIKSLDISLERDVPIYAILSYLISQGGIQIKRNGVTGMLISEESKQKYFKEVEEFFEGLTDEKLKEFIRDISGCYVGDYLEPMDFVEEDFDKRFPGVRQKLENESVGDYIDWEKVREDTEYEFAFISVPNEFLPLKDNYRNGLCFCVTYVFWIDLDITI